MTSQRQPTGYLSESAFRDGRTGFLKYAFQAETLLGRFPGRASEKTALGAPHPRERILEVADRLFYADGVRATGTEKIMSISAVAKATFYRHFESKDALVLAYLDHRDRSFWEYLLSPAPRKTYTKPWSEWNAW